jgi:hypothetical protein
MECKQRSLILSKTQGLLLSESLMLKKFLGLTAFTARVRLFTAEKRERFPIPRGPITLRCRMTIALKVFPRTTSPAPHSTIGYGREWFSHNQTLSNGSGSTSLLRGIIQQLTLFFYCHAFGYCRSKGEYISHRLWLTCKQQDLIPGWISCSIRCTSWDNDPSKPRISDAATTDIT